MAKIIETIMSWRKPKKISLEDYLQKLDNRGTHHDGTEVVDPTPMAPPVGYKRQPSMVELVREMVRSERLAQEVQAMGYETFEESDDFDVQDDYDPHSPYENDFDPPVRELLTEGQRELTKKEKAAQEKAAKEAAEKAAGKSGGAGGTPPAEGA